MKTTMKMRMYILIAAVLSILSLSAVYADFSVPTQVVLGGTSQDRGVLTNSVFTITNLDAANSLNGVTSSFTNTLSGFSNTDFNISVSGATSPINVGANGSSSLTIQGFVPLRFNSGQVQIGNLAVSGTSNGSTITKSIPVFMAADSKLEVSKAELDVNDDTNRLSNGKTIDVKRGDSLALTVFVENMFSTSTDIDISDITVYVDSNNNDLDINDQEELGTLSPRDDDSVVFNFDVPEDAQDRSEKVIIRVEGTDDNHALHTATYEFNLDVQVERYDIKINSISPSPTSACSGQTANVLIDLENTGVRDLDRATLTVGSDDLNFDKKISDIVIDQGDTKRMTVSMTIPSNTLPGTYIVDAQVYYDQSSGSLRDDQSGTIIVKDCRPQTTAPITPVTTNQSQGFSITTQPDNAIANAVYATSTPVTKKSASLFGDSSVYLIVLVFVNVLIIVLLLVLLISRRSYY